jgi:beta-glucanase (GH16 family)
MTPTGPREIRATGEQFGGIVGGFVTHTAILRPMIGLAVVLALIVSIAGVLLVIHPQTIPPTHSRLIFTDEFPGTELDRSKWRTCYPWFRTTGCTNHGNPEMEWYLPEQISVKGGVLHLTARHTATEGYDAQGHLREFAYRSAMVATAGLFDFTYGRVEFEARAPRGRGLWPTLWLLPTDESSTPEIDVMEAYCEDVWQVFLTYHGINGYTPQQIVLVNDISSGWHSYSLDWRPDSLVWYVDGRRVFSVDQNVPHEPMYLIANLAVSGTPPHKPDATTPDTAQFEVASVRVWAPPS